MDPTTVRGFNNSLCSENHTEFFGISKGIESGFKLLCIELFHCFGTVAYEDLVSVVMMVVIVMMTA